MNLNPLALGAVVALAFFAAAVVEHFFRQDKIVAALMDLGSFLAIAAIFGAVFALAAAYLGWLQ
ncbi:MAG: hypothetical protein V1676_03820 [Candidatus Diapherotrites archaeon]